MNASKMMATMTTTTQKKNTTMPGMAYPATVLALATAASYPPPPDLSGEFFTGPDNTRPQPIRGWRHAPRAGETAQRLCQCNPPMAPPLQRGHLPGAFYPWFHLLRHNLAGRHCAWGLSNDILGQLSNFGGEQAAWGPLELTNYGFDLRIHNFAHIIRNPCR